MSNRNNEDRTGAVQQSPVPVVPAVESAPEGSQENGSSGTSDVGLNWIVPTEMVDIPSRGDFYPKDHPLHGKDSIEIRHMTAREEDILTSRSLLKKGVALDKVIQSVIVDKSIKVDELLTGDKNAILVYTRMYAYGAEYETNVTCPSCGSHTKNEFNLETHTVRHPDDEQYDDEGDPLEKVWSRTETGTFLVTLPKTKIKAELKLMTGKDEQWISGVMKKRRKSNKSGSSDPSLIDQLRRTIVSLNGVKDQAKINEFLGLMPALDSRFLRSVNVKITPTLDMAQEFSCPFCGFETEMEVPFSAEFFWPK